MITDTFREIEVPTCNGLDVIKMDNPLLSNKQSQIPSRYLHPQTSSTDIFCYDQPTTNTSLNSSSSSSHPINSRIVYSALRHELSQHLLHHTVSIVILFAAGLWIGLLVCDLILWCLSDDKTLWLIIPKVLFVMVWRLWTIFPAVLCMTCSLQLRNLLCQVYTRLGDVCSEGCTTTSISVTLSSSYSDNLSTPTNLLVSSVSGSSGTVDTSTVGDDEGVDMLGFGTRTAGLKAPRVVRELPTLEKSTSSCSSSRVCTSVGRSGTFCISVVRSVVREVMWPGQPNRCFLCCLVSIWTLLTVLAAVHSGMVGGDARKGGCCDGFSELKKVAHEEQIGLGIYGGGTWITGGAQPHDDSVTWKKDARQSVSGGQSKNDSRHYGAWSYIRRLTGTPLDVLAITTGFMSVMTIALDKSNLGTPSAASSFSEVVGVCLLVSLMLSAANYIIPFVTIAASCLALPLHMVDFILGGVFLGKPVLRLDNSDNVELFVSRVCFVFWCEELLLGVAAVTWVWHIWNLHRKAVVSAPLLLKRSAAHGLSAIHDEAGYNNLNFEDECLLAICCANGSKRASMLQRCQESQIGRPWVDSQLCVGALSELLGRWMMHANRGCVKADTASSMYYAPRALGDLLRQELETSNNDDKYHMKLWLTYVALASDSLLRLHYLLHRTLGDMSQHRSDVSTCSPSETVLTNGFLRSIIFPEGTVLPESGLQTMGHVRPPSAIVAPQSNRLARLLVEIGEDAEDDDRGTRSWHRNQTRPFNAFTRDTDADIGIFKTQEVGNRRSIERSHDILTKKLLDSFRVGHPRQETVQLCELQNMVSPLDQELGSLVIDKGFVLEDPLHKDSAGLGGRIATSDSWRRLSEGAVQERLINMLILSRLYIVGVAEWLHVATSYGASGNWSVVDTAHTFWRQLAIVFDCLQEVMDTRLRAANTSSASVPTSPQQAEPRRKWKWIASVSIAFLPFELPSSLVPASTKSRCYPVELNRELSRFSKAATLCLARVFGSYGTAIKQFTIMEPKTFETPEEKEFRKAMTEIWLASPVGL
eukprot:GHVQ01033210.1.p1 GENE.GHVQ01033210.1~~GHVQ01033210.1.p1  ORF type:complete len:1040 (+),score=110.18 GHVQ01033210.1:27-3146(+)